MDDYYWRYSFYELKKRIELKVGHTVASHLAHYASLVEVASLALGGGGDDKGPVTEDLSNVAQTDPQRYAARIGQLLSI